MGIDTEQHGGVVCSLCFKTPERPKMLECCHAFCHKCIQDYYVKSIVKSIESDVVCPKNQCEKTTPLPSRIISDLPDTSVDVLQIIKKNISDLKVEEMVTREAGLKSITPETETPATIEAFPAEKADATKADVVKELLNKPRPPTNKRNRLRASNSESSAPSELEVRSAEQRRKVFSERRAISTPAKEPTCSGFKTRNSKPPKPEKKGGLVTVGLGSFFLSNILNNREVKELRELPWGYDPYDGWGKKPWGVRLK